MRQLLVVLALAVTLSAPSTVLGEATWYGSLRAGIESSDGNIAVKDGDSRWGIKGSAEAGEGLAVVYRFEHGISTENASQPEGRLAYVGLSGGFGTVTVGTIWTASHNSVGVITDNSWHYGQILSNYRQGNSVSYAYSNNLMNLQFDAIYGQTGINDDPDNDLEKVEFGLSVNVGEFGKVAVAYVDDRYLFFPSSTPVGGTWRSKFKFAAAEVYVSDLTVYLGSRKYKATNTGSGQLREITDEATFFGFRGGLGDTGINYLFQMRDMSGSILTPSRPWVFGLSKSLGGGASINFEHADFDGERSRPTATRLNLTVDF